MCDCVTYLGKSGDFRFSLFAKNSDREPNEIQLVEHYPRSEREGKLKLTHMEVEYSGETSEIVISRPYWMWGAEMGFNEHGVSAGNEAIFTGGNYSKSGLLGMDLLRLALEKSRSVMGATEVIKDYLERYGQGGSNSRNRTLYYNNSIMLADRKESAVMDLIGNEWKIRRINSYGSISNFSPLDGEQFSLVEQSGNFSLRHDLVYTSLGRGRQRQNSTYSFLVDSSDAMSHGKLMNAMRLHSRGQYHPAKGDNSDVCMHSGPLSRINKTVGSMVTENLGDYIIGWFTFSSNPCISLYKPVIVGPGIEYSAPYSRSYWLYSEHIHRRLMLCHPEIYQEAMNQTIYNQALVNELANPLRGSIIAGEKITGDQFGAVEIAAGDLDANHLRTLSALAQPDPLLLKSSYRRWWSKTDGSLEGYSGPAA